MTGLRYVYAVCHPFGAPLQAEVTGVAGSPPGQLTHPRQKAPGLEVPRRGLAHGPRRRPHGD
ncbi:gas vesicle protein, partial [Streptomyces sp. NPDC059037]